MENGPSRQRIIDGLLEKAVEVAKTKSFEIDAPPPPPTKPTIGIALAILLAYLVLTAIITLISVYRMQPGGTAP